MKKGKHLKDFQISFWFFLILKTVQFSYTHKILLSNKSSRTSGLDPCRSIERKSKLCQWVTCCCRGLRHSRADLFFHLGKLVTSWGFMQDVVRDNQSLPVLVTANPCCSSLLEPVLLKDAAWSITDVSTEIWKK